MSGIVSVSNLTVAGFLAGTYGWPLEKAARIASIAAVYGTNAVPTCDGYVGVAYVDETGRYLISDHTRGIRDVYLPGDQPAAPGGGDRDGG